jgi:hypothetical protein
MLSVLDNRSIVDEKHFYPAEGQDCAQVGTSPQTP